LRAARGASVLILRGVEALRAAYMKMEHRAFSHILLVAPISRAYLLYSDILREVGSSAEALVIPSSYDDVAVYVSMRREGYRVCYRQALYEDLTIHCLERGEKPWKAISMWEGRGYLMVFSEDPEPRGVWDLYWARGAPIIYVTYGVAQPVGIRVGRWLSLRLSPFVDAISRIYIERGVNVELEIPAEGLSYRASASYS